MVSAKNDAKDIVVGVVPSEEGKAVVEEVAGTIEESVNNAGVEEESVEPDSMDLRIAIRRGRGGSGSSESFVIAVALGSR